MSHSSQRSAFRRNASRPRTFLQRTGRSFSHGFSWVCASLVLVIALMAIGVAVGGSVAKAAPAAQNADQPQWIPLVSTSSTDIVAAVRQSRLFHLPTAGPGDHPHDLSRTGTPQLVSAIPVPGYTAFVDGYAVPIVNAAGAVTEVAVAWLNATNTALSVAYIRSFDRPLADWPTLPTSTKAITAVQSQQHVGVSSNAVPHLAYFPFNYRAQWTNHLHWTNGGLGPDDPIWAVPTTDGTVHFVGTDGHVYQFSDLPINPANQ